MQMLDREDASCLDLDWSEALRELETFIQTGKNFMLPMRHAIQVVFDLCVVSEL